MLRDWTSSLDVQNTSQLVKLPIHSNNFNQYPTTTITRDSVVQTWDHRINDSDLTKGFSIKILQSIENNEIVMFEDCNEEFKREMRYIGTKKYMHEINRCQCVKPFTTCDHFEESIDDHCVREFVEVYIRNSNSKIIIEDRKLYKEYKFKRTSKQELKNVIEEAGKFEKHIDIYEHLALTVSIQPQKYRYFQHDRLKESIYRTLTVRHDGFEDHWKNGYSYQRVNLYDNNQFVERRLSNVKIVHVKKTVYVNDDRKHTSRVMDVFYYSGKNNPTLYDNNNIPCDDYDNPTAYSTKLIDHQDEKVIINKGSWNLWSMYRSTYKRPDGSTYVTEGY